MKPIRALILAPAFVAALAAQQFQIDLSALAAKASDTVDVSLNGATLRFAAKFLDGDDPEEAGVKKLVAGLEGIYIKGYKFKGRGAWSDADLDRIRTQLKPPDWSRIVGVKSTEDGETNEVYLRTGPKGITGVAIIAAEPSELTVVNIVGPVDLDSLATLTGHFGIPKVRIPHK